MKSIFLRTWFSPLVSKCFGGHRVVDSAVGGLADNMIKLISDINTSKNVFLSCLKAN